ncbi:MAG: glycine cleavage T C-terminal barrel domain-containing protein, partial [Acidiferrobacterales bacterium]
ERFVDLSKNDFVGRDAALKEQETGPERRLVSFVVDDNGVDVMGDEPVWHDGKVVGWVTSGGYAHYVGKSVALAYIPAALAKSGRDGAFEVEILGERRPATLAPQPLFDPDGSRMRG